MIEADVVLGFLWFCISAYAILAGADFGAGVWDLVAGGTRNGLRQRRHIAATIGPVWEANHVWIIFALVILWTGFPSVFAAISTTLYIPITLVAFGIIIRGSSFALRKAAPQLALKRLFGPGFALASLMTPFFLGTIAGAIASGRIPAGIARGNVLSSWTGPTSLLGGVLAASGCAYLAAVYLCLDARRNHDDELVEVFRRRALYAGLVCTAVVLAGIDVLRLDAPRLYSGLLGGGLPLLVTSAVLSASSLILLGRRRFALTRALAIGSVVTVLWAWAVAQFPDLLVGSATVAQTASPRTTMVALIIAIAVGGVLVFPSLGLLFWMVRLPQRASAPEIVPR